MMAKPMQTLELHYPMIQFLIIRIIHQIFSLKLKLGNIQAKTWEYPRIFPNFQNCARREKDLKDNKHNSLHLGRKYAPMFFLGHYLFLVTQFSSSYALGKLTVRCWEQQMSADKYPSIFSRQMEAIVYISDELNPWTEGVWD